MAPAAMALLPMLVGAILVLAWPRVTRFSAMGLSFDVPADWTIYDRMPATTGPGQIIALIGTKPWGPCEATDVNCHFQDRLGRNEIELEVGIGLMRGDDFCADARDESDLAPRSDGIRVAERHYLRVDGRPAIATYYSLDTPDYYLSDGWRTWEIAPADTTNVSYRITARWRGPDDQAFLDALDRMVATMRLGASGYAEANVRDCGDPFPPGRTLAPGETAIPPVEPTPTPIPEPQVDCHGESTPLPSVLAADPCPDAIFAVGLAVAPVRLPIERIVLEPGPFYCDLIWPGAQTAPPCYGAMVRPGQFMHGWVWFRGSDEVAAVMLGLDLPDDLDEPSATRPPWRTTLVTVEVPPAGWVMPLVAP